MGNLLIRGINLLGDVYKLAKHSNDLKPGYDTMRKLVAPRTGFQTVVSESRAMNRAGFLLDGHVSETINPSLGLKERIFHSGKTVERVLYDKADKPLAAMELGFSNGKFYYGVLTPSEQGSIMELLADGSKKARSYYGVTNFSDAFNIKDIQPYRDNCFKFSLRKTV